MTTWNPSDKSSRITLTNGNLTATGDGTGDACARSTDPISEDTYFEIGVVFRSPSTGGFFGGVANASHPVGTWLGGSNDAASWIDEGGIKRNGSNIGDGYNFSTGQTLRFAVRPSTRKMWVQLNDFGWQNGDPAAGTDGVDISGVTGTLYAAIGLNRTDNAGTARFAAADWLYAAPSGFGEIGAAAPVDGDAAGATLTATLSLIDGAATGGALVDGVTLSAALSLIAGTASGNGGASIVRPRRLQGVWNRNQEVRGSH